jgi:hypothetical protein
LGAYAEHVEDHRLTTGQNAVCGILPSGLTFLFFLEKGDFWSLRIKMKKAQAHQATA